MRLVYDFPWSMPVDWPDNYKQLTQVVEDGDEETLYIDYQDKHFSRPMTQLEVEAATTRTFRQHMEVSREYVTFDVSHTKQTC